LILELLSAHEVPDPTAEPPGWLRRVADALHSRLDGRTPLSTLARDVGRHPVQVSRQFHRHFGCTMSTYLRRARVARAQELLVESHVTLAEVALRCGFSDQSHFTTVFHRVAGLPPHRYRERARGRHSLTSSE
jgi:transcriptional regulator GlxA family with amidase domain